MGIIATLLKMAAGKLETKGNAPGKSVTMQGEGVDGQTVKAEVYQAPGVMAIPGDGARGVWLPIGGSSRYGVVVAMQNYALNIQINAGETVIYSTTADGQTVKAQAKFTAGGEIHLNGDTKQFVTWAELNSALQGFKTALSTHVHPTSVPGPPSPPVTPLVLDISAAKTTTIKTGG